MEGVPGADVVESAVFRVILKCISPHGAPGECEEEEGVEEDNEGDAGTVFPEREGEDGGTEILFRSDAGDREGEPGEDPLKARLASLISAKLLLLSFLTRSFNGNHLSIELS